MDTTKLSQSLVRGKNMLLVVALLLAGLWLNRVIRGVDDTPAGSEWWQFWQPSSWEYLCAGCGLIVFIPLLIQWLPLVGGHKSALGRLLIFATGALASWFVGSILWTLSRIDKNDATALSSASEFFYTLIAVSILLAAISCLQLMSVRVRQLVPWVWIPLIAGIAVWAAISPDALDLVSAPDPTADQLDAARVTAISEGISAFVLVIFGVIAVRARAMAGAQFALGVWALVGVFLSSLIADGMFFVMQSRELGFSSLASTVSSAATGFMVVLFLWAILRFLQAGGAMIGLVSPRAES